MHAMGIERYGGEQQLGRRAVAEFRGAVMLDLPPDFEARLVRGPGFFDRVEDQLALMIGRERLGELDLAEHVKFHGDTPCPSA